MLSTAPLLVLLIMMMMNKNIKEGACLEGGRSWPEGPRV